MRVQLAWQNLAHNWTRTGTAAAGIGFAVVLMLLQLGFFGAVEKTATVFYDALDFDILIRSPEYLHFSETGTFPRGRLDQAKQLPEIDDARPLDVRFSLWRYLGSEPSTTVSGRRRGILVMATEPEHPVFRGDTIASLGSELRIRDRVLFDRLGHPAFGNPGPGDLAEIGPRQVTIAGHFTLGTGFGADGDVITSRETFRRIFPDRSAEQVGLGLIRLRERRDDPKHVDEVVAKLRAKLPRIDDPLTGTPRNADVEILSRAEVEERERFRWVWKTSVGQIFYSGVILAAVVGVVVTYQVLSSDISNRLAEYATLKAMGYQFFTLAKVVVQQALSLAVLGYIPGYLAALALYELTSRLANLGLEMTINRTIAVFGFTLAMCVVAALAAVQKVRRADPAELF